MTGKELEIVVGKTFSGKSTYVNSLKDVKVLKTHTTRSIRPTETGNEYYFENDIPDTKQSNIIGLKTYNTVEGDWSYWFDLHDIPDGQKSVVVLDLLGALEVLQLLQKDSYNNIVITYIATPNHEIVKRISSSSRGKTEDIQESLRRLADDLEKFWILDWILTTSYYSYYDAYSNPHVDYGKYSSIASRGYKVDVTYFFLVGFNDEVAKKLPDLRF